MELHDLYRREASTEIGTALLEWAKRQLWHGAYGGLYLSMRQGKPFSRVRPVVRGEYEED